MSTPESPNRSSLSVNQCTIDDVDLQHRSGVSGEILDLKTQTHWNPIVEANNRVLLHSSLKAGEAYDGYIGASGKPAVHPLKIVRGCIWHKKTGIKEKIMDLARGLKFNSDLPSVDEAKIWFYKWAEECGGIWSNKADLDYWWRVFERRWSLAKWPLGSDIVAFALESCSTKPAPKKAKPYARKRKLWMTVRLLREMQQLTYPLPFSISSRQLGEAMSAHFTTANRWLKRLEKDGVITCVERGKPGAPGSKATRYRFND